jgi:endonuclease-3
MARKEALEDKKKRARKIFRLLKKEHPDACCELKRTTPLDLLVATILSAQCTDVRVNIVTRSLFEKCRTPQDYLKMSQKRLEQEIRSTGFFRNKAKNIRGACRVMVDRYDSEVPATMEELLELPGVARKTANIVLSHAFGINDGIAVDTHVGRLSQRLGFTTDKTPVKIEVDLCALVPKKDWALFSDVLIFHGRRVCSSRKPKHDDCVVRNLCPSKDI